MSSEVKNAGIGIPKFVHIVAADIRRLFCQYFYVIDRSNLCYACIRKCFTELLVGKFNFSREKHEILPVQSLIYWTISKHLKIFLQMFYTTINTSFTMQTTGCFYILCAFAYLIVFIEIDETSRSTVFKVKGIFKILRFTFLKQRDIIKYNGFSRGLYI